METEGDLVTLIVISPFPRYRQYNVPSPAVNLTVGDVIEQHGPPEVARPYGYGAEELWFEVSLWYPEHGVAFFAPGTYDPGRYCLDQDSPIFRAEFTIPMTLDEYIDFRYSRYDYASEIKDELVSWPGFGCSGWFEE